MSEHVAKVRWNRRGQPFIDSRYGRVHEWAFDGGAVVRASASPSFVPVPMSDPTAVDPEEAFVASLSSCHMLWFLSIAAQKQLVVESYEDDAIGILDKLPDGRVTLSRVVLRPLVTFGPGTTVSDQDLAKLHGHAHHVCFLASALRAEVVIEPRRQQQR